MSPASPRSPLRLFLEILAPVASVLLLVLIAWTLRGRQARVEAARVRLDGLTTQTARHLSTTLVRISGLTERLADRLGQNDLDEAGMTLLFRQTLESEPSVLEVGAAYQPGARGAGSRLFAPHYGYREGVAQAYRVDEVYDYTERDWYRLGIAQGPVWGHPYFGEATRSWVVGFMVPIHLRGSRNGGPVGVVRINYSLSAIRALLTSLPLGNEGYAAVVARNGKFVHHPIEDFIQSQITIAQLAGTRSDALLMLLGHRLAAGETGMMERPAVLSGEASWSFYRPIQGTDWMLVLVFMKNEIGSDATEARHEGMWLTLTLTVTLLAWAFLLLRIEEGAPRRLWIAATLASLVFTAGIVEMWRLSFDSREYNTLLTNNIHDQTGLLRFVSERRERARRRGEPDPVFLPTGVFVQSIDFAGPTDVLVNGTIWQKYAAGQAEVTQGFSLPDAVDENVVEAYRIRERSGQLETVGWHFRARLRQQFAFGRYPLDFQNIRIRVARRDFKSNVILLPDIASYESLIPQTLPGVDRSFVTAGWAVQKTFFSHALTGFNTDFGIDRFVGKEGYPDLAYNVVLRRDFIPPFIANIVPLILIAGITFALFCMVGADQSHIAAFDARGGRTTGTSAALFFAILLAHIRLRSELVGLREMIYIEYFYFIMYVAVLALVVDVYAVGAKSASAIVRYRDNLIPRVLFWPLLTAASLVVTVWFFY